MHVSLLAASLCFSSCEDNAAETTKGSNYVLAACANEKRVVLYDMATYDGENLDNNEVWSFQPTAPEADNGGGMSGVKYREDTVFGDVVIVCASRGYAGIVSYPEGEVLWDPEYEITLREIIFSAFQMEEEVLSGKRKIISEGPAHF